MSFQFDASGSISCSKDGQEQFLKLSELQALDSTEDYALPGGYSFILKPVSAVPVNLQFEDYPTTFAVGSKCNLVSPTGVPVPVTTVGKDALIRVEFGRTRHVSGARQRKSVPLVEIQTLAPSVFVNSVEYVK